MIGRYNSLVRRMEEVRPRLFRTALAWSRDRALAEDLAQETVAKALTRIGQLQAVDALEGWLFRIMMNLWRDHVRRDRLFESVEDVDVRVPESPEDITDRRETVQRVRDALDGLPHNFREALILVDLEGFTYAETAEIVGVPVGTVMSRLSRGRKQLRHLLEPGKSPQAPANESRVRQVK